MVASNQQREENIRCIVLAVPYRTEHHMPARELLPWADPYIATLVERVKAEIEADREPSRQTQGAKLADELEFRGDLYVDEQCDLDAWQRQFRSLWKEDYPTDF